MIVSYSWQLLFQGMSWRVEVPDIQVPKAVSLQLPSEIQLKELAHTSLWLFQRLLKHPVSDKFLLQTKSRYVYFFKESCSLPQKDKAQDHVAGSGTFTPPFLTF